jgi:hypothetical protein
LLFVRLAWGGVVEIEDAVEGGIQDEQLVLVDCTGRAVARFPRIDVRDFSAERAGLHAKRSARV